MNVLAVNGRTTSHNFSISLQICVICEIVWSVMAIVVMIFYSHFCGKCFLFLYMSKSFGGRFFDASLSSFATSFEKLKTVLLNGSLTCFLSALVHCWFELHSTIHQLSISILLSSSNVGGCLYVVMETNFPRARARELAWRPKFVATETSFPARGSWHGNQSSRARELLWKLISRARELAWRPKFPRAELLW